MLSFRPEFLKALAVIFSFSLAKAVVASAPSNTCTGPILCYVAFLTSACREGQRREQLSVLVTYSHADGKVCQFITSHTCKEEN